MFVGSTRTAGPPHPTRVGDRVAKFVERRLQERGHQIVNILQPRDFPHMSKPQFAYPRGRAPEPLDDVARDVKESEAFVMITPEYNHTHAPGLLNILNHFGSSLFSYKPSAIVSYSQGQWGGVRAAHSLRAPLSELGCLPVSAMVHVAKAHEALDANGIPVKSSDDWEMYGDRTWSQLEWWGEAASIHRESNDPFRSSKAFQKDPSQRNAPGY